MKIIKKTMEASIGASILPIGMNAIAPHDTNGMVKTTMSAGYSKKMMDLFGVK